MFVAFVQIVPYLVCMSTDGDKRVSHTADRELQDIEKKYPGFIHMKLMRGIRLSYSLQQVRAQSGRQTSSDRIPSNSMCVVQVLHKKDVIRGFRITEGELPAALNGYLYSILKVLIFFGRHFDTSFY